MKMMTALKMTVVMATPGQRRRTRRNDQYLRIVMHLDAFLVLILFRQFLLLDLDVFLLLLILSNRRGTVRKRIGAKKTAQTGVGQNAEEF
jgi:hypothetical protein